MLELRSHKEREIDAPADRVWSLIADFGAIGDWWPPGLITKVENVGEGVGMVRHIHTVIGIVLQEKLESIDDEERCLELTIVGDLPAGMSDYQARGKLHDLGPDRCRVEWTGTYKVPGPEAEKAARGFIEGAYEAMFQGLADASEQPAS